MGQPPRASTSGKACAMKSGGWTNSDHARQPVRPRQERGWVASTVRRKFVSSSFRQMACKNKAFPRAKLARHLRCAALAAGYLIERATGHTSKLEQGEHTMPEYDLVI